MARPTCAWDILAVKMLVSEPSDRPWMEPTGGVAPALGRGCGAMGVLEASGVLQNQPISSGRSLQLYCGCSWRNQPSLTYAVEHNTMHNLQMMRDQGEGGSEVGVGVKLG